MKIRTDFVTNSSSSSFIIATNQPVPDEYVGRVARVTEENLIDIIKETSDYRWTPVSYNIDDEEIKQLGGFTDQQIDLLKLAQADALDRYFKILKKLKEANSPVYYIFEDRDWLYNQYALEQFIKSAEMIDEEYDL